MDSVIHMGVDDSIDPGSTRYLAEHGERRYLVGRLKVAKQLCLIVVHADAADWEASSCGTMPIDAEWDGAYGSGTARLVADGGDIAEAAGEWTVLTPNLAVQPG